MGTINVPLRAGTTSVPLQADTINEPLHFARRLTSESDTHRRRSDLSDSHGLFAAINP